jgi:SNF family Na+-dependent transporter
VFVGWVWRVDQAIEEIELHGVRFPARRLWSVLIRYVCPVAISVIIVYTFVS